MTELETSLHLYQPPLYSTADERWYESFEDAVVHCQGRLTWDLASILSIASFGYAYGNRTLLKEVKRRPWLSEIDLNGESRLENIPVHGVLWKDYDHISTDLIRLLCDEVARACQGREHIYVLLSCGSAVMISLGLLTGQDSL
jgi:hypothetical protein